MSYSWVGSRYMFLDEISVTEQKGIHIGRYGGNTLSGASKNEDGLIVLQNEAGNWRLAVVLDAHHSAESAELVVDQLLHHKEELSALLEQGDAFEQLQSYVVSLLSAESFRAACRHVKGETALLMLFQHEQYVWWLSVGDCVAYVLHPELAQLGQYALNQRQFYEWIGQVNTFDQPVPCYSSGRRQLRNGRNVLVLVTDGIVEGAERQYEQGQVLYDALYNEHSMSLNMHRLLNHLHTTGSYDSATMICWEYDYAGEADMPSDQKAAVHNDGQ
ncbi:protein phosphatase 2C domain-containing protein [Paenibacillus sp. SGZ-1009]|uniref:protein phosphatase 2C domain-containing protein n=1 Tax=Paenibacillus campi TaxID=3106031 RepID=UPI002B00371C|nr:protein phosphatase 2C domain-containing protein [Paenibacillus sp. SGZ-1009]